MNKQTDSQSVNPLDFGPQSAGDNPFTKRMRFHQSWYRANKLKVPYGTGPKPTSASPYGNMLRRADGERGLNFLSAHTYEIAKRRLRIKQGTLEPFRLLCNMLSSQPMCFNLFAPLVDDFELAERVMQRLLPDEIGQVNKVVLEYAPEPARDYLNDQTAFDAFVAYTRADGLPGFVGIETKLTEPFSPKAYSSPVYQKWLNHPQSPWPAENRSRLLSKEVNQLWRDHLLGVALRLAPGPAYAAGRFMLVYHALDVECVEALEAYKTLLKPDDDSFSAMPLDELVRRWKTVMMTEAEKQWLEDFSLRYLELEASQAAFEEYTRRSESPG